MTALDLDALTNDLRDLFAAHGVPADHITVRELWQGDEHAVSLAGVDISTYTRPGWLPPVSECRPPAGDEFAELAARLLGGTP